MTSRSFMRRFHMLVLLAALLGFSSVQVAAAVASKIDREKLLDQYSPSWTRINKDSAFMVGNGNFAFTADITGLQTFPDEYSSLVPLMIQSQWAWHSFPNPHHYKISDAMTAVDVHGKAQQFPYFSNWSRAQEPAIKYLRENPHRFSLGRVGFHLTHANGSPATMAELTNTSQRLDLRNGVLISNFVFDDQSVHVETRVHPERDMLIVKIRSQLLQTQRLSIDVAFPGVSQQLNPNPADWQHGELHRTQIIERNHRSVSALRQLDDTRYFVQLGTDHDMSLAQLEEHHWRITSTASSITVMVTFSHDRLRRQLESIAAIDAVRRYWHRYWSDGGFVDFTGSTDPRATELQRRVLLSQYLMAVNAAGEYPPQEDGLFSNSWNGKFHLEMSLWHVAHFATWGHPELLERTMKWYVRNLDSALRRAEQHGVRGAWWPKMVGSDAIESPSAVNPFIMWQQPHPIYLAELIYRTKHDQKILHTYQQLVFETAELLASYPTYDKTTDSYRLDSPFMPVQEMFDPLTTVNPAFELEYFRVGLQIAQQWRERLHLSREAAWDEVLNRLSPLPQRDGIYLPTESTSDFWKQAQSSECSHEIKNRGCLNRDHPSMLLALGLLHGDRIDQVVMRRTFEKVNQHWDMRQLWGWDYPMMAMTAARLNLPGQAVQYLFLDQSNNQFDVTGMTPRDHLVDDHYVRDSTTYFPSNGALLMAVGMMAAGWDGETRSSPGFPQQGWKVRSEGLLPLP